MTDFKVIQTKEITYSRDVYRIEISLGSLNQKMYSIFINGVFNKNYLRLPKDLKQFFKL